MEVLTSFGVDIKLLVSSIINFCILLYILNKLLYKPLLDALDNRKKTIQESLHNAELVEKKLKETEEHERAVLHQARLEAQSLLKKAEEQAGKRQQEILDQAYSQAKTLIAQAEKRMHQQSQEMQQEIQANMADLVMAATKTILEQNVPKNLTKEYTERVIKSVQ